MFEWSTVNSDSSLYCSLLMQLRCQVHVELSKCEEDMEQIEVAKDHLRKVTSSEFALDHHLVWLF